MNEIDAKYLNTLERELKALQEQNASQNSMYEMTTLYMKELQEELQRSEEKLTATNKHLTDSINYSKRIQDALSVQNNNLQKVLSQSFIFSHPKDIVSGDFVWLSQRGTKLFLAVGDCTGHGVPGAMLSILMISILNQILSGQMYNEAATILSKLDTLVTQYLGLYTDQLRDSAEIAMVDFDIEKKKLVFSGANRPLVHVRNKVVTLYKGTKFNLGYPDRRIQELTSRDIEIEKDDMIYMFSDGYGDQFGGSRNSKFSSSKLISLFGTISGYSMAEQHQTLLNTFERWKTGYEQIDDVMVIGFRID
jgi:serine phosphatase RsbU (regulator of sigma subunit)